MERLWMIKFTKFAVTRFDLTIFLFLFYSIQNENVFTIEVQNEIEALKKGGGFVDLRKSAILHF